MARMGSPGSEVVSSSSPWRWHPELAPWLERLAEAAERWDPAVGDGDLVQRARCAIADASATGSLWLYHPCMSAVLDPGHGRNAARDITALGWLVTNARLDGSIELTEPTWLWSPTGGQQLAAGTVELADVSIAPSGVTSIDVDPWCLLIGEPVPDTVAAVRHEQEREALVRSTTVVMLRSTRLLDAVAPDLLGWLTELVKVVVPLDSQAKEMRSSSSPAEPGLIYADAGSELAFLELAVHEAAHHLLYLSEAAHPLVDIASERRFASPLRPDPRPVRGILLAFHALAYIAAMYREVRAVLPSVVDEAVVEEIEQHASASRQTLQEAQGLLTDAGMAFVERTDAVLAAR